MKRITLCAAALGFAAAGLASAQEYESAYTRIDDGCEVIELPDEPVWETTCDGYDDWDVLIVTDEHGSAEAYRAPRGVESDYISPPMRGLFGSYGAVIEWRLNHGQPFATIHRYTNDTPDMMDPDNAGEWQTLVVVALRPNEPITACAVAYIDASSLPNANEVARQAADYLAIDWMCGQENAQMFDSGSELDVMSIAVQRRPGH